MISDPTLFVDCDSCGERVDFTFGFVIEAGPYWRTDKLFSGWQILWTSSDGNALCPECTTRLSEQLEKDD